MTLDHLFSNVIDKYGLSETQPFIWDRTRAIRKDLILQDCKDQFAIDLHERIARYHIMCTNVLCSEINVKMECDELRNTLKSLVVFYDTQRLKGLGNKNEVEFMAYYILLHPGNFEALSKLEKRLPKSIFVHPEIQKALEISFLMSVSDSMDGSLNHYSRIFTLLKDTGVSYLFACCAHIQFVNIRISGLSSMQKSYYYNEWDASSGIPLQKIIDHLGFDSREEATSFLKLYSVEVIQGHAQIGRKVTKEKKKIYPDFPCTIWLTKFEQFPTNLPSDLVCGLKRRE